MFGVFAALYVFLFGLDLMGVSFKAPEHALHDVGRRDVRLATQALGGKGAGQLFTITENPISGPRGLVGSGGDKYRFDQEGSAPLWVARALTGLMVGILATVLVQSSSTSLSA